MISVKIMQRLIETKRRATPIATTSRRTCD